MTKILSLLGLLALAGCTNETLDGGSVGDGTPASNTSPTNPPNDAEREAMERKALDGYPNPLLGTIGDQPFKLASAEISYDKKYGHWFLTFRNYRSACGVLPDGKPDEDTSLLLNVAKVSPTVGMQRIAERDDHGATFQRGLYEASSPKKPSTEMVSSAFFEFQSWSDVPGTTVAGRGAFFGEGNSKLAGTFTLTVCPPR